MNKKKTIKFAGWLRFPISHYPGMSYIRNAKHRRIFLYDKPVCKCLRQNENFKKVKITIEEISND